MIITKHVTKRVNDKVIALANSHDVSIEQLIKEIKIYLIKAGITKGIPISLAEDITARLIVLIALVEPEQEEGN